MSKSRVLFDEDTTGNFEMVRFLLERAGNQRLEGHNRQMGLDLARQEFPDLALMDPSLVGVDGLTAARELKADPKTFSIPLLTLTVDHLSSDRNCALGSTYNGVGRGFDW